MVGAGPAGAVAAASLAKAGRSVALLAPERVEPWSPLGETIPPAAVFVLEEIAGRRLDWADPGGRESGHLPWHGRRSAWGTDQVHEHSALFDVQGHGWRIDRLGLELLLRGLAAEQGAQVLAGWRLAPHEPTRLDGTWRLRVVDGEGAAGELNARILVDASGRRACALRYLAEAGKRRTYDRLVALTLDLHLQEEEDDDVTSMVESVEEGYWYSVLGPGRRRVFALFTDSDLLAPEEMRDPVVLLRKLAKTKHVEPLLEGCVLDDPVPQPRIRPASTSRRRAMIGDGWVALGDAAMTFDPIGSQGIYTAMRTALEAARCLVAGSSEASERFQTYVDMTWSRYLLTLCECYHAAMSKADSRELPSFWRRRELERLNRWR